MLGFGELVIILLIALVVSVPCMRREPRATVPNSERFRERRLAIFVANQCQQQLTVLACEVH